MSSIIDFHMHSSASDGKDTLAGLFERVKLLGIKVFSLTDHDTIEGAREMERLVKASDNDIAFVRGIEFSCITPIGKCHILGYGYNWDSAVFISVLSKGASLRKGKLEQRISFLKEKYGIVLPENDVEEMRQMGSVGKPHIAEIMVRIGVADTISEAISEYIDNCPTMDSRIPANEVIHAVRESGGISVWAHPYGGVGEERIDTETFNRQLNYLKEMGLQGLECYYSRYTMGEAERLAECAKQNDLLVSGGSDYHGRKNYPEIGTLNKENNPVNGKMVNICGRLIR